MALRDRYWMAATLAACAFIAATKLPPDEEPQLRRRDRQAPEIIVQNAARRRLQNAAAKLAILQWRDSALALARRNDAPPPGKPRVFYGRDIPPALRVRIDSALERELAGLRTPLDALPVVVLVVSDTSARVHAGVALGAPSRWLDETYILPSGTDGRTCVSIVRAGRDVLEEAAQRTRQPAASREESLGALPGKLLGPCAYYGAHGMPGPPVAAWLEQTRYWLVLRSPATNTDSLRSGRVRPPTETFVDRMLRRAGWSFLRDHVDTDITGCVEGRADRCAAALGMDDTARRYAPVPPIISAARGAFSLPGFASERVITLGLEGRWFVAALHDQSRPEEFGQFWRSERPPEEAFASASGAPLSAAARQWMMDTYDIGPARRWPHPTAGVLQLLLAGGALGLGLVMRGRRTVDA